MYWLDALMALLILALSLGIGWLLYRARMEWVLAADIPAPTGDPVAELRQVNADIAAAAREGARHLENAAKNVQAGVR